MLSYVMDRINTNRDEVKMIATQDKIKVSRSAKEDTVGATIWNHQVIV
jgi:hypothetical protein